MNIEHDYLKLLKDVLDNGREKSDRTGTGTISVFGRQIRHKMSEGFPLLTTKKMYWKGIITELLWFLRGDTNIKYLVDNDCHIWDGDAYKKYLNQYEIHKHNGVIFENDETQNRPFSKEEFINWIKNNDKFANLYGELGPIYGKQWRSWGGYIKTHKYGWVTKEDNKWAIKWSDLHSFGHGNHWTYTPIKNTDGLNDSDIDTRVVFDFESDYENFNPIAYAIIDRDPKKEYVNHIDQIQNSINLLKTDPDSRRNIISAWSVGELDKMTLPPCHNFFQFYTRELSMEEKEGWCRNNSNHMDCPMRAISLMYNARSQDVPLGTPFNIASYALLLVIIAKMVNMVPDELITNMGDCHIYMNQIDGIKEQLTREPYRLPKLVISDDVNFNGTIDDFLNSCSITDFQIEDYKSHKTIKMPLSN